VLNKDKSSTPRTGKGKEKQQETRNKTTSSIGPCYCGFPFHDFSPHAFSRFGKELTHPDPIPFLLGPQEGLRIPLLGLGHAQGVLCTWVMTTKGGGFPPNNRAGPPDLFPAYGISIFNLKMGSPPRRILPAFPHLRDSILWRFTSPRSCPNPKKYCSHSICDPRPTVPGVFFLSPKRLVIPLSKNLGPKARWTFPMTRPLFEGVSTGQSP